jgi:hypothetical protein
LLEVYWRWKSRSQGDRSTNHRGVRLARRTEVCGAKSGPGLRERFHPARSRHGHSGSADLGPLALAEWIRREVDRLNRRKCLDHVVVFGERHLRNLLRSYQQYYNECRSHLSYAPFSRAITAHGRLVVSPVLGGLRHQLPDLSFRQGQESEGKADKMESKVHNAIGGFRDTLKGK